MIYDWPRTGTLAGETVVSMGFGVWWWPSGPAPIPELVDPTGPIHALRWSEPVHELGWSERLHALRQDSERTRELRTDR